MEKLEKQIADVYKLCRITEKQEVIKSFRTTLYDIKLQSKFERSQDQKSNEQEIVFGNSTMN